MFHPSRLKSTWEFLPFKPLNTQKLKLKKLVDCFSDFCYDWEMKRETNKKSIPIIDIKKYGGKQIAILNGKIVASGCNLEEIIKKIKLRKPSHSLSEFRIFSVPKTLSVIYYASK